jgi:hypothetical protein
MKLKIGRIYAMTQKEIQLRLVKMMYKLNPNVKHAPSARGVGDDLDYVDIMMSHVLLDMEAKVREAKATNG